MKSVITGQPIEDMEFMWKYLGPADKALLIAIGIVIVTAVIR
jgi:hypothetical protein